MKTIGRLPISTGYYLLSLLLITLLWLYNPERAVADSNPVTVSGYEAFIGLPCQIDGEDGSCGVRFYGWFGGDGAVPDGWAAYTGIGGVVVRVNYVGEPGFGNQVTITGGTWRLTDHGPLDRGTITSGTVIWPLAEEDLGCGAGIATVETSLADGAFDHFVGCLHDFDVDGEVAIPPKIWGTFQ